MNKKLQLRQEPSAGASSISEPLRKGNITIIRIKSVCYQTGMSRSHIYHLAAQGIFPKSVSLVPGGSSKGWVESEVQGWISSRVEARNAGLSI
jgi:prophage regulatory protein